jgi:hypothetical protein
MRLGDVQRDSIQMAQRRLLGCAYSFLEEKQLQTNGSPGKSWRQPVECVEF